MNEILKNKNNLGGFLNIWIFPIGVIWVNGKTVSGNLDEGYKIYCTPETISFQEPPEKSSSGTHYKTSITAFTPNNNEDINSVILALESKKIVAILLDSNENYIFAGTSFYPLKFSGELISGILVSDLGGYKINLSGDTIARAVFIDNPF